MIPLAVKVDKERKLIELHMGIDDPNRTSLVLDLDRDSAIGLMVLLDNAVDALAAIGRPQAIVEPHEDGDPYAATMKREVERTEGSK